MIQNFNSLDEITRQFPNEEACMAHLEKLRWNGLVTSPFDPVSKVYQCKLGRYRCRNTGKYFNAKTGTLFYNTKVPLQKWFMAIWIITGQRPEITSVDLAKELDLTQKSAWLMLRRIRKHFGLNLHPKRSLTTKTKQTPVETQAPNDGKNMLEWLQMLKK